jgi:hypothetical protein
VVTGLTQPFTCSRCGGRGVTTWDSEEAAKRGRRLKLDLVCDACLVGVLRLAGARKAAAGARAGEMYACALCGLTCEMRGSSEEIMAGARALFPAEHLTVPLALVCSKCFTDAIGWAAVNAADCLLRLELRASQ